MIYLDKKIIYKCLRTNCHSRNTKYINMQKKYILFKSKNELICEF